MESKEKKRKNKTLIEDLNERNFNTRSIMNVIKYSLNGIKSYADEGKSIIIYFIGVILEIILGIIFNIDGKEWIFIISMLGVILSVELINTAIEKTCDAITKEYNPYIKIAKDCGSASTFVMVIVVIFLNIVIYYPKVTLLFK